MKSSKVDPKLLGASTSMLRARFKPLLDQHPDHIALWLPLYKPPTPNQIYRKHWTVYYRLKMLCRSRLYNAQLSKSPNTGQSSSTGTTNGAPASPSWMPSALPGSSPETRNQT